MNIQGFEALINLIEMGAFKNNEDIAKALHSGLRDFGSKPLSDEKIEKILYSVDWAYDPVLLVKAIEKEHGIV
jgi:hypothetical protein